jgi:pilus assembly protein CpaC
VVETPPAPGKAFFRELRQGDASLERWNRMQTTGDRLKEALEFLVC